MPQQVAAAASNPAGAYGYAIDCDMYIIISVMSMTEKEILLH